VLRPWSKTITMGIAEDGIAIATSRADSKRISTEVIAFDSADEIKLALLANAELLEGKKIDLVVSNFLVRYVVLPWNPYVASNADWQAIAQETFKQEFDALADWVIRLNLNQFGAPVVATAMHPAFYNALYDASRLLGFEWNSIMPAAIYLLNQANAALQTWVMIAEPHCLQLCTCDAKGALHHFAVASPPAGEEFSTAQQLLARYHALATHAPKQTLVYVSGALTSAWKAQSQQTTDVELSPIYARNIQFNNCSWLTQLPI
jgi:hypothetical protein